MDLLVTKLTDTSKNKRDIYDSSKGEMALNLPISNISNKRPITIENNKKYLDAINQMLAKSLPSVIVTEKEEIFSVVSYKDIFKLVKKDIEKPKYMIEYIGKENVYGDEFELIQEYANKTMQKITKKLNKGNIEYDTLKIVLKTQGNTEGTHLRKIKINISISKGSHTISISNEITQTNTQDIRSNKNKQKWNPALLVQTTLKKLEKRVFQERKKRK